MVPHLVSCHACRGSGLWCRLVTVTCRSCGGLGFRIEMEPGPYVITDTGGAHRRWRMTRR